MEAARKECEDLGILPRVCHLPFTYRYSEPRDENFDYCHAMTCRALKQIGYTGDFNLEIDFNRVPQALLEDYLGYSARVARYLISVFDNA